MLRICAVGTYLNICIEFLVYVLCLDCRQRDWKAKMPVQIVTVAIGRRKLSRALRRAVAPSEAEGKPACPTTRKPVAIGRGPQKNRALKRGAI
jgi:hypothetical protein